MLIDTIALELFSHTEQWKEHGRLFLHDGFFLLREFGFKSREFLVPSQPYLLREGRIVLVRQGTAHYKFDLVDYEFRAGDLVVFHTDTLIEKQHLSPDFQLDACSFRSAPREADQPSFTCLHLTELTRPVVDQYFQMLWTLVHQHPYPEESMRLLTEGLLHFVGQQHTETAAPPAVVSRGDDLLRRFIALVSRHASCERNIPFYAERLCIAPHYLSTLIKQQSGQTVMQWINQAAVKEIKVWLAYSDESAAQIADRLHFPHPSSLTKFFKRETGMTPMAYRQAMSLAR